MRYFYGLLIIVLLVSSCTTDKTNKTPLTSPADKKKMITALLDSMNAAAATADFKQYFSFYADSSVFMGTDATEYWDKDAFMKWAKPYFDKKTTWDFTALQRNIYFGKEDDIAWFDELLDTQMKICRGSGVVVKENNQWKIKQYILSMTIPNQNLDEVLKAKSAIEDSIIAVLKTK